MIYTYDKKLEFAYLKYEQTTKKKNFNDNGKYTGLISNEQLNEIYDLIEMLRAEATNLNFQTEAEND